MTGYKIINHDPDLVAGWNMNVLYPSSVRDVSGNGYDAVYQNNPIPGYDRHGSHTISEGFADRLDVGATDYISTVIVGVNPLEVVDEDLFMFDRGGLVSISVNNGEIYLSNRGGTQTATFYVNAKLSDQLISNEWQFVVATLSAPLNASDVEIGLCAGSTYFTATYSTVKPVTWIEQEFERAKLYL